jgi:hypothetical protein
MAAYEAVLLVLGRHHARRLRMKAAILLTLSVVLLVPSSPTFAGLPTGAAPDGPACERAPSTGAAVPEKPAPVRVNTPHASRLEGDTIEDCWTIPSLPFTASGSTSGFTDDYDEACPYTGSTSPDVVYSFEPSYETCISIDLCASYYDTKVYVYVDGHTPGDPIACNDDNFDCVDPPVGYTSWIDEAPVKPGHTYYIVIDGYGGAYGDYVLEVADVDCTPPCEVPCEGLPEGEPVCYDDYEDHYNGGCSSTPPIFQFQPTGEEVVRCGESGVFDFDGITYRDTDWYLIRPGGSHEISITVEAEFSALVGFVTGISGFYPDCFNPEFLSYSMTNECTPATVTEVLPDGDYVIFVSTSQWYPEFECGSSYALTVKGYTEVWHYWIPVEEVSWGSVKALYH